MNLCVILPEIFLSAGAAFFCAAMIFDKALPAAALTRLAAVFAGAAAVASLATLSSDATVFAGAYRIGALSQLAKFIVCASLAGIVPFSRARANAADDNLPEYLFFLFVSAIGMAMLVSAADLITFYVGLEMAAYPLYVLTCLGRLKWNSEAAIKYLIFGAASSALFLFGAGILMGLTGEFRLDAIAAALPGALVADGNAAALSAGIFLLVASLFFKLSFFPFHFWAPDAYEAAPPAVTAFIATASKAAAAAALVRVFLIVGLPAELLAVIACFAFLSMAVGNTAALWQRDLKRLLAYSSVAQAGYIALGFISGPAGYTAVLFYAACYALMNLGAFLVVLHVAQDAGTPNPSFRSLNGLAERSPLLALVLLVSLLSLAGIPPFCGFTGKWFLFTSAMRSGHWFLVVTAAVQSVISLFYYLTAVKCAYLHKPENPAPLALSPAARWAALATILAIVALGVLPQWLLRFAELAVAG